MTINPTSPNKAFQTEEITKPARVDRKRGAKIITDLYFPVSHRTLEKWPINWLYVNGRATCDTGELLALAEAKLNSAPGIMGNRKTRLHLKGKNFSTP